MLIKAIAILALSALAAAENPNVVSPQAMTYTAGEVMNIEWRDAHTGFVNIDLTSADGKLLEFPKVIAQGVPAESGKYSWKIPEDLKSSSNYCVRVWGDHQPNVSTGQGVSHKFTILNTSPTAINTFRVTSPNTAQPCTAGQVCKITWDYPENNMHPAMVDIGLYRVGSPELLQHIATVSTSLKSYDWVIPKDATNLGDVYVSVSGQGIPPVGPGQSNNMGGNSQAFIAAAPGTTLSGQSVTSEQEAKQQDGVDSKKEELEKKKKEEEMKKKKEMPKKKETENKKDNKLTGASTKKKNAADKLGCTVGVLGVAVAAALLSLCA